MKLLCVLLSAGSLYFPLAGPNISFQLLEVTDKIIITYVLIFRFQKADKEAKDSVPNISKYPQISICFFFLSS
jgi:hypothetical protein